MKTVVAAFAWSLAVLIEQGGVAFAQPAGTSSRFPQTLLLSFSATANGGGGCSAGIETDTYSYSMSASGTAILHLTGTVNGQIGSSLYTGYGSVSAGESSSANYTNYLGESGANITESFGGAGKDVLSTSLIISGGSYGISLYPYCCTGAATETATLSGFPPPENNGSFTSAHLIGFGPITPPQGGSSDLGIGSQPLPPSGTELSGTIQYQDESAAEGLDCDAPGASWTVTWNITPQSGPPTGVVLEMLNPFAPYAMAGQAPPSIDPSTVAGSPMAQRLAADGESAVALYYLSPSPNPATFSLTASSTEPLTGAPIGALTPFDPNYLVTPNPVSAACGSTCEVNYAAGPDAAGNYTFLALLWGPANMPLPAFFPLVTLNVTASQDGVAGSVGASLELEPPPLLLIHGMWSSAAGAGFAPGSNGVNGFYNWISKEYPHNLIYPVDYGKQPQPNLSAQSFDSPEIQSILLATMTDALAGAANDSMAARTVDVFAHSMGGLVTLNFLNNHANTPQSPVLLPSPVHRLITVGTPYQGSTLASTLWNNQDVATHLVTNPLALAVCAGFSTCTLGSFFSAIGRPVAGAVESLQPMSPQLQNLTAPVAFDAIVGLSPTISWTEAFLDLGINLFLPSQSVNSILGLSNDTIVATSSQGPPSAQLTAPTVQNVVHVSLCSGALSSLPGCDDIGETASPDVWTQAYYWLTGGTCIDAGLCPAGNSKSRMAKPRTSASPSPGTVLDLSGYTEAPASNVSFQPASGSTLTVNTTNPITATSSTKTITEVVLLQTVLDPADIALSYVTQSPFTIPFTPMRLGSATFGAITVFNDNTYAITPLNYTLQTSGSPFALNLTNVPVANMVVGASRVVGAQALFTSGALDVTSAATYSTASNSAAVIGVGSVGTVTANGDGADILNVSYGGLTATAQIVAGPCTFTLNPANQIVASAGGKATIQVATQTGCAWTASGGAAWAPLSGPSGSGDGAISINVAPNTSGQAQTATVTLGGSTSVLTQPATACTYSLSQNQIQAPAAGVNGAITVTTGCPIIASADQSWVSAAPVGSTVQYGIATNNSGTVRSANLTVGVLTIPVTQAASLGPCDLQHNGTVAIADVQLEINQAMGLVSQTNDLNSDGIINVEDVQIEIDAVLELGCNR